MNKLFTIENIEKESENASKKIKELDTELAKLQKEVSEDKISLKKAYLLEKIISGRKSVLTSYNSIVKESRLILSTIVKEEGRLRGEMARVKADELMGSQSG